MSRKQDIVIGLTCIISLLVSVGNVFGGGSAEEEAAVAEPPAVLSGVGHSVHEQAADGLIEEFLNDTGVGRVEWDTFGIGEIHSTILRQSALPSAPFDFGYVLSGDVHPRMLSRFEPLDDWLADYPIEGFPEDFSEGMLEAVTYDGALRAIPMRGVVDALHVNVDLFEERGIDLPRTFEEFVAAAHELTFEREDGTRIYGYSAHGTPGNIPGLVMNFAEAMFPESEDSRIVSSDYRVTISENPTIEAISLVRKLYEAGVLHPDISTHSVDDVTRLYETGRLAMWVGNITNYDTFNDPERSSVAGSSEVIALPYTETYDTDYVGVTPTQFWSFMIPGNTHNAEYAWKLIRHLSSAESQLYSGLNNANQPTRASALANEEYAAEVAYAELASQLTEAAFVNWPPFEGRSEAADIAGNAIIAAMHGDTSPEDATAEAADQIRRLLEDEGLLSE